MQFTEIHDLCLPALIYLVISVLSIIGLLMRSFSLTTVLLKSVFVGLWTWFLDYLCRNGYSTVSWILVLMPFIMFFGIVMFILEMLPVETFSSFVPVPNPQNPLRTMY